MVSLGSVVQSAYDPWAVQSRVGLSDARLALDSLLMPRPNLSYIDYRSGVMASGDTAGVGGSGHMAMRVKPGGGMSVTVEMGNCVINTPSQGAYMCALDSVKTLALAASSSTTNRIDLIIARVYDDLNSAIASPSGVRKFTVEVWQGDPVTGTPVVPTPTPVYGWTPLAAVTVNKNVATITTAMIDDRRGPGLVARGGMRALYGKDAKIGSAALAEPGAYPGDQRWVHNSGFQHQVYYGSGSDPDRSGWRGVKNGIAYLCGPTPNSGWFTPPVGAPIQLARLTIPPPGTPYSLVASARVEINLSPNSALELRINLDHLEGPRVNWTRVTSYGATADHIYVAQIAPVLYGHLISPRDVVLSGIMRVRESDFSGFGWDNPADNGYFGEDAPVWLCARIEPSHIQPPDA